MRAGVYYRISQDRTGNEFGVERQREDGRALIDRRGWDLHREYIDNDVSAAGKRKRDGFEALLADIASGQVQVVVAWALDRICRTARDRLRLVEACKAQNTIVSLVRGSDMDLSTPAGRLTAGVLGEVAQHEIDAKSDRQKRAAEQAAQQGRWTGGRRPFGYEADGVTIREAEAKALETAYNDYLAGTPIVRIAERWNAAGLLSGLTRPDGKPTKWSHSGVRNVMRNPRNAGFRTHNGEIVGKAEWPPVVTESTYRAVVALLDSAASEFKPHGGRRLLTGVALCGTCIRPLIAGGSHGGKPQLYRCPSWGHVSRRAEPIEEFVTELVLRRFRRPDLVAHLIAARETEAGPDLGEQAQQIRDEMLAISRERMQRVITPQQFAVMNAELRAQLADVERRMSSTTRSDGLREFIDGGVTPERWEALGVDQQRVYIAKAAEIRVFSGGRGVRKPPPETIEITWKQRRDVAPS